MDTTSHSPSILWLVSPRIIFLLVLTVALLPYGMPAQAQPGLPESPVLLTDINPGVQPLDSAPQYMTVIGDHTLFFADGSSEGFGLWRSDGTDAGTEFIWPAGVERSAIRGAAAAGPYLFFVLIDDILGSELWRSDGTAEGTTLVRKFNPWPGSAFGPFNALLMPADQQIFFVATDTIQGWGLWVSDGTAAGTMMLRELEPASSYPPFISMFALGNRLYFEATDSTHGPGLWVSDGTIDGTRLVYDISPDLASGDLYSFGAIGETLLFSANDGVNGIELWRSDGSESGTYLVADINPGPASSYGQQFSTSGNQVFFLAENAQGRQLWRSDGTEQGTQMVPRSPSDTTPFPDYTVLHVAAGCVYIDAHPAGDSRLLASCGGAEVQLLRTFPRSASGYGDEMVTVANHAVFTVRDGPQAGLWISDGTTTGTEQFAPLGNAWELTLFAGKMLLSATDSIHGQELWVSDGTQAGTRLVKDINTAPAGSAVACSYRHGNQLFFSADDGTHGQELWTSDGTPAGTRLVADLAPDAVSSNPCDFAAFGGTLVFVAAGKLWRTDGTTTGTRLITTAEQPAGVSASTGLTVAGDQGFFTSGVYNNNTDLWVLDTNLSSARLVKSFYLNGQLAAQPIWPRYALGQRFVFGIWTLSGLRELWASDGTAEGTSRIAPYAEYLDASDNQVLFMDASDVLWATDGSPSGATQLSDALKPYDWNSNHDTADSAGGPMFFAGQFWLAVSDGTRGATRMIAQLTGTIDALKATNNSAFFGYYEPSSEYIYPQLWHTDGTTGSAELVRAFEATDPINRPQQLTMIGDRLIFVRGDRLHGRELWVSDGSADGTRLCRDFNPGPASSLPSLLGGAMILNNRLILAADDGAHGEELWSIPIDTLCNATWSTTIYMPLMH